MFEQVLFSSLLAAARYLLVALGFWLILRVGRFFDLSYGAIFALAAYLTFSFRTWANMPLAVAVILAVVVSAIVGCLIEKLVYARLRADEATALVLLLASLGVYVVLQNLLSLMWGDETRLNYSATLSESMVVLGANLTKGQTLILLFSVGFAFCAFFVLRRTRMGTIVHAVANDPELARISGIDSNKVSLATYVVASALAALAGCLVSFDLGMNPTIGMSALFFGAVAVIAGGTRSIAGAALGALIIGVIQQVGSVTLGAEWQDGIVFAVLIVFLLARPQGILGGPLKKAVN